MKALKNSLTIFVGSRYIVYVLQFVRGLAIAAALSPVLYGVWGFLTLVQSYLIYGTLGVEFALNVILSTGQDDERKHINEFIGTSFLLVTGIGIAVILGAGYVHIFNPGLFSEFQFSRYAFPLAILIAAGYFQQVLLNLYRFHGLLKRIVAVDLGSALLTIVPVFLFTTDNIIMALIVSFVLAVSLGNLAFLVGAPFRVKFHFNVKIIFQLLSLAIPLMIFNLAANLLVILSRTVIGAFYSVESLGFYTFAFNISNSVFLGLSAVGWAIFPELLSKMKQGLDDRNVAPIVQKTNNLYGGAAFIAVVLTAALSPLLFLVFPSYAPSLRMLGVLLITQGIGAIGFGYSSLIYSRRKVTEMIFVNLVGCFVGMILALVVAVMKMDYYFVAIALIIGQTVQLVLFVRSGSILVRFDKSYWKLILDLFSWGRVLAIVSVIVGTILDQPEIGGALGAGMLLLLDRDSVKKVCKFALQQV